MREDTISRRQFTALVFVSILPLLIRQFPRLLAENAGRDAWFPPLAALLPLAAAALVFWLLYRKRPAGTGFPELLEDLLGNAGARLLMALYALWMLFHAGFLLRSGGVRFVSTVYPAAAPDVFIVCAALACAPAACGSLRALGRMATLLRPLLAAIPMLVFLLTVKDADFLRLLPVGNLLSVPCWISALRVANVFGIAVCFSCFGAQVRDGPFRLRDCLPWTAGILIGTALVAAGCIGIFGAHLTGRMTHPFFMLTRDVSILGALERVEPAAIAVWVFADYVLISALLRTAARNLRFALKRPAPDARTRSWRRYAPPLLCTVLSALTGLLLPGDAQTFSRLSEITVPAAVAVLFFGLPLLLLPIAALRGKLH